MRRYLSLLLFICLHYTSFAQTDSMDYMLFCYLDGQIIRQEEMAAESEEVEWSFPLDDISEGIHLITAHAVWADGRASNVAQCLYFRPSVITENEDEGLYTVSCYVDDILYKSEVVNIDEGKISWLFDTDNLEEGLHTVRAQAVSASGESSSVAQCIYYHKKRMALADEQFVVTCYVDGVALKDEIVRLKDESFSWILDTSDMPEGIHVVTAQAVASSGAASNIAQCLYMHRKMANSNTDMQLLYSIDGGESRVLTHVGASASYHFDIDVSTLDDGLHQINYVLTGRQVGSSSFGSAFFKKIPLGGNGIKQYEYWINDSINKTIVQTIDPPQSEVGVVSLIPVESQPIRSSHFKFVVNDGTPIIYALNTFHARFIDVSNHFTEISKDYYDENISHEVIPVGELQPRQSFSRVAENDIRWYTLEASIGDSLSFRSTQACSMQLFSPSGKEIYAVSGAESTMLSGCHAPEDGIYYLAIHDVTGTRQNMEIEYEHIDKYAVLWFSPDKAGNLAGNGIKMKLLGNGFDKMVKATITDINGNSFDGNILSVDMSKATIEFTIDEKAYTNGLCDITLYYVDENGEDATLCLHDAFTLEAPDFGEIEVKLKNGSSLARPLPVTIEICNTGNINYTYIPFNLAWDNPDKIQHVQFNNFLVTVAAENDSAGYSFIVDTDNLFGKGEDGTMMFFYLPRLNPHSTMKLQLDFTTPENTIFNMWAWCGTPVELDTANNESYIKARRAPAPNTSNRGQNMINFGDAMADITGIGGMPARVSHAGTVGNLAIKTGVTIGSSINAMGRHIGQQAVNAYFPDGSDPFGINDVYNNLYPEVLTHGSIVGGILGAIIDHLLGCQNACAQQDTPNPGNPHQVSVVTPIDPNDIIGYMSESGSKFMQQSVTDLHYTIEFENDPNEAMASAHTIIVTDTLDAEKFDLSTFKATSVKIGDATMYIDGEQQFTYTMDLRPAINVIAEVSLDYNTTTGIARWTILSLDPMTMEPTDDAMQGVLPVNYSGNGMGEVSFSIRLKSQLAHEESVSNRAEIVFDKEAVIMTPTWKNTVDAIAPTSVITDVSMASASTAAITVSAIDELSKPWKYDVYHRKEKSAEWELAATNIPVDSIVIVPVENGLTYDYYVLVTDSAGNKEIKEPATEFTILAIMLGDVNDDGEVDLTDAIMIVYHSLGQTPTTFRKERADMNGDGLVDLTDAIIVVYESLGVNMSHNKIEPQ